MRDWEKRRKRAKGGGDGIDGSAFDSTHRRSLAVPPQPFEDGGGDHQPALFRALEEGACQAPLRALCLAQTGLDDWAAEHLGRALANPHLKRLKVGGWLCERQAGRAGLGGSMLKVFVFAAPETTQ